MEIKGITLNPGEGYEWHNIKFPDFESLENTVVSAAALAMNKNPQNLILVHVDNSWQVVESAVHKAQVIPIDIVYAENGTPFPPGEE